MQAFPSRPRARLPRPGATTHPPTPPTTSSGGNPTRTPTAAAPRDAPPPGRTGAEAWEAVWEEEWEEVWEAVWGEAWGPHPILGTTIKVGLQILTGQLFMRIEGEGKIAV